MKKKHDSGKRTSGGGNPIDAKGLDGYMTLEAAMVFPAVFLLVIMLLYVMFFQYDKCRMVQDLYTAAYRKSIARGGEPPKTEIDTSGFFMLHGCTAEVADGREIRAKASGRLSPAGFTDQEEGAAFMLTVTMSARRTDPPRSFRRYRRLAAIAREALSQGGGGAKTD